jgi:hypothetical protein
LTDGIYNLNTSEIGVSDCKAVRQHCYRSAMICSIRHLEMLDGVLVTPMDKRQAKRRIKTLREYMKSHDFKRRHDSPMPKGDGRVEFENWKPESYPLVDMPTEDCIYVHISDSNRLSR